MHYAVRRWNACGDSSPVDTIAVVHAVKARTSGFEWNLRSCWNGTMDCDGCKWAEQSTKEPSPDILQRAFVEPIPSEAPPASQQQQMSIAPMSVPMIKTLKYGGPSKNMNTDDDYESCNAAAKRCNWSLVIYILCMVNVLQYLRQDFWLGDKTIQRGVLASKDCDKVWKLGAAAFTNVSFDALICSLFCSETSNPDAPGQWIRLKDASTLSLLPNTKQNFEFWD